MARLKADHTLGLGFYSENKYLLLWSKTFSLVKQNECFTHVGRS